MKRARIVGFAFAGVLAASLAFAHHAPASLGTVNITQPVMAGGTMLQPGMYEIRDTGEHPKPLPGQSDDAQARIEFIAGGQVVAKEIAEVMTSGTRPVGTSGRAGGRLRVERLKGDEFVRVSAMRDGERYLIHLPVAR